MKCNHVIILLLFNFFFLNGKAQTYFPPTNTNNVWDTIHPEDAGFDSKKMDSLHSFVKNTNGAGYLILYKGKIVAEKYFNGFNRDSLHAWNSAGKTMTAFSIGIAQEKGLLKITDTISKIYKQGWTSCTKSQEDKITVLNLLTMTSGLDDKQLTNQSSDPKDLKYLVEPNTRWMYHTGAYRVLMKTITSIYGKDVNIFNYDMFQKRIGMKAFYYNEVAYSKLSDMARFGLLLSNKGIWDKDTILKDTFYLSKMRNTSQPFNPSYGYLTWLNGKSSFILPASRKVNTGKLIPTAPNDMYCALGKDDQKIYIVPSMDLVVCRFGDAGNGFSFQALSDFDTKFWEAINYARLVTSIPISENQVETLETVPFPNPLNGDILKIKAPFYWYNHAQIHFFDSQGKRVYSTQFNHETDISTLPKGVYIYQIVSNFRNKMVSQGKFIKQ